MPTATEKHPTLVLDVKGKVIDCDPQFEHFLGFPYMRLIGEPLTAITRSIENLSDFLRQVIQSGPIRGWWDIKLSGDRRIYGFYKMVFDAQKYRYYVYIHDFKLHMDINTALSSLIAEFENEDILQLLALAGQLITHKQQ